MKKNNQVKTEGSHIIADIWFEEYPQDIEELTSRISDAITENGMTIIDQMTHVFGGLAFTAVWLLQESHFTIHTYPERNYVSMDCYTCGATNPLSVVADVLAAYEPLSVDIKYLTRGVLK